MSRYERSVGPASRTPTGATRVSAEILEVFLLAASLASQAPNEAPTTATFERVINADDDRPRRHEDLDEQR